MWLNSLQLTTPLNLTYLILTELKHEESHFLLYVSNHVKSAKKRLTVTDFWITSVFHQSPREKQGLALTDLTTLTALRDDQQLLVSITSVHLAQK